eukprot:CAMPEP_0198207836 /NCGR_PEP_ID=MMETSP1445-20131203/11258_1 /TAXON_ID=36898 /ORGANISM="Pyramimonas sp., Strain CCMP2087" /LENGTH=191 /DNA_ID=CAMNT_0043881003 /DNA_START=134 /DNA_END=709 /DNA_ORIENTATION=+
MVSGPEIAIVAGVETAGGDVWWTEAKVCPEGKCISIDFSKKTDGKVGMLEATPVAAGILFPDGNTWTKNTWTEESGAAGYIGKYADEHHAEGWRTIAVSGSEEAIVAGVDEKGGPAWSTKGTMVDDKLNIDFSEKSGGAVGLLATEIVETGIKFPDGNVWTKYVAEVETGKKKCDVNFVKDMVKEMKCVVA